MDIYFHFSWVMPWSGSVGSYDNSVFNLLRNCQTTFPKYMYHFTFPPAICEASSFFTPLSTFVIICSFYCSSPNGTYLNLESHIPVPYCDLFFLHLIMVILVWLAASYSSLIALYICKPIFCSSFSADPAEFQTGLDDWSWI